MAIINDEGLALIKKWEGYLTRLPDGRCKAYLDRLVRPALRSPGYPGLWTIGYGCTEGVYEGLIWTEAQAEKALLVEVAKHAKAVDEIYQGIPLDDNQRAALISLSYNVGPSAVRGSILTAMRKGDETAAADAILGYCHAGGRVVKGLQNRRREERALFLKHTPAQVIGGSRKLRLADRLQKGILGLGIGGTLSWETLSQVRSFATDNIGLILLGVAGVSYLIFHLIKKHSVEDYNEGRYIPSGVTEEVAASNDLV